MTDSGHQPQIPQPVMDFGCEIRRRYEFFVAMAGAWDGVVARDSGQGRALPRLKPSIIPGLPKAAFVITMSKTRSRLSQQIEAALDEYGLPVLQARTTDPVAYPQAVIEGKSVLEGRDRTARNEIFALRDEIERLFDDP